MIYILDVIGYMLFWTCVYVFQFTLYLQQQSESFQISNVRGIYLTYPSISISLISCFIFSA